MSEQPQRTERRRSVSMADVAARAGVSSQTVSRVANGFEGVLEPTRVTVLAAMEELGYRPNSAARALKRGSFRAIGVISFTLSTVGNVRTVEAIAQSAAESGYAVTLIPVALPTESDVRQAFSRLEELAVDAIIAIMEVHLLDSARMTLPPGVPLVVVDSDADGAHAVVDTDQADGARQAVEHLLGLGHRTVHHLSGPAGSFAAERRALSWQHTLAAAGRSVPPAVHGDWSAESGYRIGRELAADADCTAVFCANDQMALGLYRALGEAGRRVPEDVSVVGFDDIPDAAVYSPPLTTVRQDFAEVGRRCVRSVLEQLDGGSGRDGSGLVPTRLLTRGSTSAPAA